MVTAVFLVFQSANGAALIHPAVVRGFGGDEKNWSLTMHSLSGCCSHPPCFLPEHTTEERQRQTHGSTQLQDKAKDTRAHNWKTKPKTQEYITERQRQRHEGTLHMMSELTFVFCLRRKYKKHFYLICALELEILLQLMVRRGSIGHYCEFNLTIIPFISSANPT